MRYSIPMLLLAGLAACSSQPGADNAGAPQANVAVPETNTVETNVATPVPANMTMPQPTATPAAPPVLTATGWGPLTIGMTEKQVHDAVGAPTRKGPPDFESCEEYHPPRTPKGMWVMIEQGRLARIGAGKGSDVATAAGIRVGDSAKAVEQAYGKALQRQPHEYVGPPGEYLTLWQTGKPGEGGYVKDDKARGIRFEIGTDGTVDNIYGGGPAIQYVEGCA